MKPTTAWNVTVLVPHSADSRGRRTPTMDQLLQLLDSYAPVVVRDEHHVGARMWIDAPDALAAAAHAVAVWNDAKRRVGLGDASPVQVIVVREEEFRRQVDSANFPALVGVTEIAELIGVSRARASEISRTAASFPRPVAQLASGPVWTETSVRAFAEDWPRRPGRPRRRVGALAHGEEMSQDGDRIRLITVTRTE